MFMQKIIMHIDMNSYFASCEQQDNLAWRNKPLGVCEHLGGIIIAPSIEAKRWGIKTGTPVWEARRLYPKIILVPTAPQRYRYYTGKFLKVLGDYTDQIEKYSIDEAFLDVTKACNIRRRCLPLETVPVRPPTVEPTFAESTAATPATGIENNPWQLVDPFDEARAMAREIKRRITREVGDYLKVSIGIAWNKLVAKIASDMQKPDGLVVARPQDKENLYKKLQLTDIPGIAHSQERNLNMLGIKTLADLRDYPQSKLVAHCGIMGYHLYQMGQLEASWKEGFDDNEPIKSMGHVYTIPQEYRARPILKPVLYKLSEMVGTRLRANGLMGDTVSVHVHDSGDNCYGRSHRLGYYVFDGREIYLEAMQILRTVFSASAALPSSAAFPVADGNEALPVNNSALSPVPIKLVGVTVSGIADLERQQSLFPREEKQRRVVAALDRINEKYEDFTVARVPAFLARDIIRDSIGFGRMKEFKTLGRFVGVH